MTAVLVAAPFVNAVALGIVVHYQGWLSMAVVLGCWALQLLLQYFSSKSQKRCQALYSAANDRGLTLAHDLIVGCRTIKCYGWEDHYVQGIKSARKNQYANVYWINVIHSYGTCVF